MEIVLKNTKSKDIEIFSLLDLDNIHETFKRFSSINEPLEAKIFSVNEILSSHQLSKLKNHFDKINICSLCIYSNNRSKYLEIFSLLDLDNIHETFKRFSCIKEPLDARIFAANETISSHQL